MPSEPGLPGFSGPARHQEPAQPFRGSVGRRAPGCSRFCSLPAPLSSSPSLRSPMRNSPPEAPMSSIMSFMPVVWIVWAAVITFLLVLLVYRSNLTRYEEDQIFSTSRPTTRKRSRRSFWPRLTRFSHSSGSSPVLPVFLPSVFWASTFGMRCSISCSPLLHPRRTFGAAVRCTLRHARGRNPTPPARARAVLILPAVASRAAGTARPTLRCSRPQHRRPNPPPLS